MFIYISLASVPAWILFTLWLYIKRGQTAGQYIPGLAVDDSRGASPSLARILLSMVALHPLVFHPILGIFWLLAAFTSASKEFGDVFVIAFASMAGLCMVAPFVALIVASADGGRRALHDRVAGTMVVRLE
jgi:hypothetical protein